MTNANDPHGSAPLHAPDVEPMHAAVDALADALHEYVNTAAGVRAEFGAAEADEDPRILALEAQIGRLNADLFDALHNSLGMHPDLTSAVWQDTEEALPEDRGDAEPFYLGFVIAPTSESAPAGLDHVIDLLDESGANVVAQLIDAGFDVSEWAASRGEAAEFDGFDFPDDGEVAPS